MFLASHVDLALFALFFFFFNKFMDTETNGLSAAAQRLSPNILTGAGAVVEKKPR